MKVSNLLKKYDNIVNDVANRVTRVNCGGCGVYALMLGKQLKKQNIKFDYVLLFRGRLDRKDSEFIKNCVNNNDIDGINGYHWTHVMIKLRNKKYIDGKGIFDYPEMDGQYFECRKITSEVLKSMVGNTYIWNPSFNRKREQPKIRKIFKKHLDN